MLHLTLGTHGMDSPNMCSVVLVAGSALQDLQSVSDKLYSLMEDMLMVPYAMFLLTDNPELELTSNRHEMLPAVVTFLDS